MSSIMIGEHLTSFRHEGLTEISKFDFKYHNFILTIDLLNLICRHLSVMYVIIKRLNKY